MLSILLPAARRSLPEDAQTVWGDLRVALASIQAYAPGVDVVVGWNGLEEPKALPDNPHVRLLRQAPGITTGSEAWNWCATQTDAEELLILGDDCVLHPDTLRLLLEDVAAVSQSHEPIGFVGCRSNYVKGVQNIRSPNAPEPLQAISFQSEKTIFQTDMVVPVAAWIRHATFDSVGGFPPTNWFADDVCCWDLAVSGHHHFVSRAYVHHVGERATGQGKSSETLLQEGLAWLRDNRPDFLVGKLGIDPAQLAVAR
ncbi:hypothetical protein K6U06_11845 [Acidiferrimicrobium sp. IK]|uniref:glycosyltransferase family 2 protein n=1 Tax=Acidiferrimicrobium sp. IK TaxID=2871700 RepID=UPI0021CB474E|nr:hypothetical protein [Acidiferrimicrobium sp. IK]MCU4185056.1 hypothetical protein [Acidiferrimicrobium sp. IK]